MKVICLTGGIATGKSTVTQFLADKGAKVIDADKLGHRVYALGSASYKNLVTTFGTGIVAKDGQIDRKALGARVFGKPRTLKKLTAVVWPEIRRLAEESIAQYRSNGAAIVVLEAAILFEAGWQDMGDETWVVTADPEIAIERAMRRDGLPRGAVEKRLKAQLDNHERVHLADVVIDNSADLNNLMAQLDVQWLRLKQE